MVFHWAQHRSPAPAPACRTHTSHPHPHPHPHLHLLLCLCLILVLHSHYVTHLSSPYLICTTGPFVSVYRTYLGSCPHLEAVCNIPETVCCDRDLDAQQLYPILSYHAYLPILYLLLTRHVALPPPDLADDLPLSIGDTRASCYQFLTHFLLYISQYVTAGTGAYTRLVEDTSRAKTMVSQNAVEQQVARPPSTLGGPCFERRVEHK